MARGLKVHSLPFRRCVDCGQRNELPRGRRRSAQPAGEQVQNLPAIVVTVAEERTIVDRVISTGTIQPVEEVYVAPLVDGLSIRSLGAEVADRVKEGDTLATLNDDALILTKSQQEAMRAKAEASLAQIEAQLIEAKANAEEADKARERAEKLVKSGATSQAIFDQATAAAKAAVSRVTSAEQAISVSKAEIKVMDAQIADIDLKLARTAVKAPVSGIVSSRTAKIGAIAMGASQPLFSIIRNGEIELKADVSETSILKLAVGQTGDRDACRRRDQALRPHSPGRTDTEQRYPPRPRLHQAGRAGKGACRHVCQRRDHHAGKEGRRSPAFRRDHLARRHGCA